MASNLDFDFAQFSADAINTIDQMRSSGRNTSGQVGLGPVESRINAFYRVLGLPAVQDPDDPNSDTNNVGNLFDQGLDYQTLKTDLGNRETAATIPTKTSDQQRLQHFVVGKPSDNLKDRPSGNMLPCVVNGTLDVFPQSKRVCTPFQSTDDIQLGDGRSQLKRPLIETVIYFRLKGLGVVNSSITNAVSNDFGSVFDTTITADVNGVNVDVSNVFRSAMLSATESFVDALKDANSLAAKTSTTYALTTGNVAQAAPTDTTTSLTTGAVEVTQDNLNNNQVDKRELLTLLEYSDSTLGTIKRNMVESVLASNVISVLSAQEVKTPMDENDTERKASKLDQQVKDTLKALDLFMGDYSALSGLDMLVVIDALFEVEMNTLLGLLNDDAWENLTTAQPLVDQTFDPDDVGTAVTDLQNAITDIYEALDAELTQDVVRNKQAKQS